MEPEKRQSENPQQKAKQLVYLKPAPTESKLLGGRRFVNKFKRWEGRSLGTNVPSFFYENWKCQPDPVECARQLPTHTPDLSQPAVGVIKVTWISHATVLIQDGPVNIITDPVFVSSIKIYKRLVELPVQLEKLPRIDLILISHDHMDHYDEDAVKQLVRRDDSCVIIGKQSKDILPKNTKCYDLDWTNTHHFTKGDRKYKIVFLPSCHWSGRGLMDHFKRLWGGFLIITPEGKKIYYPGDTGFEKELFDEINQEYGDMDLCLLPIGAYEPRNFLCFQHIDPEEAVKIHVALKSKQTLGIHWGTFQLACEKFLQPRQDLERELLKADTYYQRRIGNFCCVEPGQSIIVGINMATPIFGKPLEEVTATWLGHSSILLQYGDCPILVNPQFDDYSRLFTQAGKALRRATPAISIRNLKVDVAAILLTEGSDQFVQECRRDKWKVESTELLRPSKGQSIEVTVLKPSGIQVTKISTDGECSYIIQFSNGVVICVYGQFVKTDHIKSIRQQLGKKKKIDYAFIPIRPLVSSRWNSQYSMLKIIDIHESLDSCHSAAVNWGAFPSTKPGELQMFQDLINKSKGEHTQPTEQVEQSILQPKIDFEDAQKKLKESGKQISRPFTIVPMGQTTPIKKSR